MSNLNGESLHDWINSERKRASDQYYLATKHRDDDSRAYNAGIVDILETLKAKLLSGQVNPFGDRNPLSD